ncbi:MAG: hypothetical protein COS19_07545, partial [Flavobacteriaceae bacterium CG02_land_8_20_14_3_00_34_13]
TRVNTSGNDALQVDSLAGNNSSEEGGENDSESDDSEEGSGCDDPPCKKGRGLPSSHENIDSMSNSGYNSFEQKFSFKKGESPFILKEINYIGAGEGVSGTYSSLEIVTNPNAPEGLKGQKLKSNGLGLGFGFGAPIEVFTATRGMIHVNTKLSVNNLEQIINSTKFITVRSVSAVIKYTRIEAYTDRNMNTLLWHTNMVGGGVITASLQGSRSIVEFKESN